MTLVDVGLETYTNLRASSSNWMFDSLRTDSNSLSFCFFDANTANREIPVEFSTEINRDTDAMGDCITEDQLDYFETINAPRARKLKEYDTYEIIENIRAIMTLKILNNKDGEFEGMKQVYSRINKLYSAKKFREINNFVDQFIGAKLSFQLHISLLLISSNIRKDLNLQEQIAESAKSAAKRSNFDDLYVENAIRKYL